MIRDHASTVIQNPDQWLFFWAKKTPPRVGRRSNYAHLTDINLQPHHHSFVKSTGQKNSPEMRISGPTTMLSSLNCPHHSQLASSALETTVTGESRITQVFRREDIRYPDTHPFRYHISNLRHTFFQRTLIHNHFRQRGEHRERQR